MPKTKLDLKEIKKKLKNKNILVQEEKRLKNNTGTQLCLNNGGLVTVYDSGKFVCGGKAGIKEETERLLNGLSDGVIDMGLSKKNKVFVVYGHDTTAKTELEAMLRRWDLNPVFLDQLPSEGQTIIEKLEKYTDKNETDYAVILATPDDEGFRKGHSDEIAYRARQNVVLELGMLLAKLGRNKVAILLKQSEKMERPSDVQGLIYIPFDDDLQKEAGSILAKEMAKQGFDINVKDL